MWMSYISSFRYVGLQWEDRIGVDIKQWKTGFHEYKLIFPRIMECVPKLIVQYLNIGCDMIPRNV